MIGFCPDFFALGKTRLLLRFANRATGIIPMILLCIADFVLSLAISVFFTFSSIIFYHLLVALILPGDSITASALDTRRLAYVALIDGFNKVNMINVFDLNGSDFDQPDWSSNIGILEAILHQMTWPLKGNFFFGPSAGTIFLLSTLLTSSWMITMIASTLILKFFVPVHRFTAWFFDVKEHPLRSIGTIAGAIIFLGGFISTLLRSVI